MSDIKTEILKTLDLIEVQRDIVKPTTDKELAALKKKLLAHCENKELATIDGMPGRLKALEAAVNGLNFGQWNKTFRVVTDSMDSIKEFLKTKSLRLEREVPPAPAELASAELEPEVKQASVAAEESAEHEIYDSEVIAQASIEELEAIITRSTDAELDLIVQTISANKLEILMFEKNPELFKKIIPHMLIEQIVNFIGLNYSDDYTLWNTGKDVTREELEELEETRVARKVKLYEKLGTILNCSNLTMYHAICADLLNNFVLDQELESYLMAAFVVPSQMSAADAPVAENQQSNAADQTLIEYFLKFQQESLKSSRNQEMDALSKICKAIQRKLNADPSACLGDVFRRSLYDGVRKLTQAEPALEKTWIKQATAKTIEILRNIPVEEREVALAAIEKLKAVRGDLPIRPFKLDRKQIATLIPGAKPDHSFYVFDDGQGGYKLGVVARGKPYVNAAGKTAIEGIAGSGASGVVKVIVWEDGTAQAIKVQPGKENEDTSILRALGKFVAQIKRNKEARGVAAATPWIQGVQTRAPTIEDKSITIMELASGKSLATFLREQKSVITALKKTIFEAKNMMISNAIKDNKLGKDDKLLVKIQKTRDKIIALQEEILLEQIDFKAKQRLEKKCNRWQEKISKMQTAAIIKAYQQDGNFSEVVLPVLFAREQELLKLESQNAALNFQVAELALLEVQKLHAQGILHCDIKPSNFVVDVNPETQQVSSVRLTDFDSARQLPAGESEITTKVGDIPGSPGYAAPEVMKFNEDGELVGAHNSTLSKGADIYALGQVFEDLGVVANDVDDEDYESELRDMIERMQDFEKDLRPTAEEIAPVLKVASLCAQINAAIKARLAKMSQSDQDTISELRNLQAEFTDELLYAEDELLYAENVNIEEVERILNAIKYLPTDAHDAELNKLHAILTDAVKKITPHNDLAARAIALQQPEAQETSAQVAPLLPSGGVVKPATDGETQYLQLKESISALAIKIGFIEKRDNIEKIIAQIRSINDEIKDSFGTFVRQYRTNTDSAVERMVEIKSQVETFSKLLDRQIRIEKVEALRKKL